MDFGGHLAGAWKPWGVSYASWADPADPTGWSANLAILLPTPFPWSEVTTAYASGTGTFGMKALWGMPVAVDPTGNEVTVDLSSTPGSATVVYDVNTSGVGMSAVVTVSPVDPTTAAGQAAISAALVNPARVRVFGVPEADGHVKAYVLFYFTGN